MEVLDIQAQNVAGMLATEKLDGVFATWTGRELLSRNGKRFEPSAAFLATLPEGEATGEVWAGRGRFQSVLSAIRGDWEGLEFIPFDSIPATPIVSVKHLSHLFESITEEGAEGLVLEDPDTGELFKIKKETTLEARVIDHNMKAGCFKSLKCKLENGVVFNLAFTGDDAVPVAGKYVTFSCFEFTDSGKPRVPKFVGVRDYE